MTQNENKGNRFDSVKRWVVSIEAGVEWGRGVGSTYHRLPNLRTHFRDQWNLYFLIWEQKLWYAADPLGFWYEWADGLSGSALILCNLLRCIFGFKKRKAYLPSNGEGILGQMSVSVTPRLIWGVLGYRTQGLFIKVYFVCCLVFCFLVFFSWPAYSLWNALSACPQVRPPTETQLLYLWPLGIAMLSENPSQSNFATT